MAALRAICPDEQARLDDDHATACAARVARRSRCFPSGRCRAELRRFAVRARWRITNETPARRSDRRVLMAFQVRRGPGPRRGAQLVQNPLGFAPNLLKKAALTDKVHGFYLPYWTFDAQANCPWTAEAGLSLLRRRKVTPTRRGTRARGRCSTRAGCRPPGRWTIFFNDETGRRLRAVCRPISCARSNRSRRPNNSCPMTRVICQGGSSSNTRSI